MINNAVAAQCRHGGGKDEEVYSTRSRFRALMCSMFAVVLAACLAMSAMQPTWAFADEADSSTEAAATDTSTSDSSDSSASDSSSSDPYHSQKQADKEAKEQAKAEQEAKANQEVVADAAAGKSDGTYYGSAYGYQSLITVAVTVQDGMITGIKIVSHADDQSYVDLAMREIDLIIANQSTDVDTISGVTYSSTGILEATKDALSGDGAAAATNSMWFSVLMIVLALVLLAAAVLCARKWLQASKRAERSRIMRVQRVLMQLMFFLLAPSAFASGFMGLKTLFMQIQVMQTQRGYDFELSTFTIFTIVFLLVTVVLGRFFCGYACAFGFAGDILYRVRVAITDKLGVKVPRLPEKVEFALRFVKYVVLVAVCALVLAGFTMTINQESPWTAFSSIVSLQFQRVTLAGGLLLLAIAVGCLWKERFFCEFLCPLGALFSLVPTLPTGRMRRDKKKCRANCKACRKRCPVGTEPAGRLLAGECIMCNRCADVCPAENVVSGLEARMDELQQADAVGAQASLQAAVSNEAAKGVVAAEAVEAGESSTETTEAVAAGANEGATSGDSGESGKPATQPKRTVAQLLMARPVAVIWKAALLLLVFWLLHITRFLPIIS